ncbi:MAG: hypothetical protein K2H47_12205 [Muribaculaceae bacterium]|nr:hypothetical protein [Muribaculaceae bacterium]
MTSVKDIGYVTASSRLLITELQLLGAGYYSNITRQQSELETKARSLCAEIKQLLAVCKEEYIPELLDCLNLLHPIAFQQPLPQFIITTQLQRLFAAWQSGNKDIAESDLYALITLSLRSSTSKPSIDRSTSIVSDHPTSTSTSEISHSSSTDIDSHSLSHSPVASKDLSPDQLLIFLSLRDNWLTTLRTHNYFPEVTTYENYRRLTLLTEEPAIADVSSDEEKLRWYRHNRIEDLSTLSIHLLICYRRYILSLPSAVLNFEQRTEQDTAILHELLRRKDLHLLDREAYRLSLEYNRLLSDD